VDESACRREELRADDVRPRCSNRIRVLALGRCQYPRDLLEIAERREQERCDVTGRHARNPHRSRRARIRRPVSTRGKQTASIHLHAARARSREARCRCSDQRRVGRIQRSHARNRAGQPNGRIWPIARRNSPDRGVTSLSRFTA